MNLKSTWIENGLLNIDIGLIIIIIIISKCTTRLLWNLQIWQGLRLASLLIQAPGSITTTASVLHP